VLGSVLSALFLTRRWPTELSAAKDKNDRQAREIEQLRSSQSQVRIKVGSVRAALPRVPADHGHQSTQMMTQKLNEQGEGCHGPAILVHWSPPFAVSDLTHHVYYGDCEKVGALMMAAASVLTLVRAAGQGDPEAAEAARGGGPGRGRGRQPQEEKRCVAALPPCHR
jgi:hypothetical protein